jgi:outer membrane receptor protein involved in Fe transport
MIGCLPQAMSQEAERVRYDAYSLEELFKLEIITASKQEELIYDAPGVVTVITAFEIEQFGAQNLGEILDRVPGVVSTFATGINRVTIRGGEPNTISALHVLLLINGRPLRTSGGNYSIYSAFSAFPLDIIERVEIVRGPGSVLYGTNAVEGVINIITKAPEKAISIATKFGPNNAKGTRAYIGHEKGDFKMNVGVFNLDTDGWVYELGDLASDTFEDAMGINLNVEYNNFTFSTYAGRLKQWSEGTFSTDIGISFHSRVLLMDAGFRKEFNDKWSLQTNATFNRENGAFIIDFKSSGDQIVGLGPAITEDMLYEATLYGQINDKVSILFGGVYQKLTQNAEGGAFGSPLFYAKDAVSAYSQLNWRPSRFAKFICGFQLNKPQGLNADVVPRFGGIFSFNPNVGVKLLFGDAYRSPTEIELKLDTPDFQRGNENLDPETISTVDLQFFARGRNYDVLLSAYKSTEDQIKLVPVPDLVIGEYRNEGELKFEGIELEGKYSPAPSWYLLGSYTHQKNENELGLKDVTLIPTTSAKLGFGYSHGPLRVGVNNNYISEYKDLGLPEANNVNPPSEPVNLLSANVAVNFKKILGHDFIAEIYGTNLLDEDVWVPDLLTNRTNTIRGADGRGIYGSLKYVF